MKFDEKLYFHWLKSTWTGGTLWVITTIREQQWCKIQLPHLKRQNPQSVIQRPRPNYSAHSEHTNNGRPTDFCQQTKQSPSWKNEEIKPQFENDYENQKPMDTYSTTDSV